MHQIHPSARVARSAIITGEVKIGPESCVLDGAVVNGDLGPVSIGTRTLVMEHAIIRGRAAHPVAIGDHVLVGPHAHLNGAHVEDEVFIATGASMFPGSRARRGAELRINCVVHVNSTIVPGCVVPIGWIAAGDPAQLFSPEQHEALWGVQETLDFPGTVYGVSRDTPMSEIMQQQTATYRRTIDDRLRTETGQPPGRGVGWR